MTEKFEPGDRVRITIESPVDQNGDYVGIGFEGYEARNPHRGSSVKVEVIEKANHARNDPPGTFRCVALTDDYAVKVRDDYWILLDSRPTSPSRWTDDQANDWGRVPPMRVHEKFGRAEVRIRTLVEPDGDQWYELAPGLYTWGGMEGSVSSARHRRVAGVSGYIDHTPDAVAREAGVTVAELVESYVEDEE